MMISTLNSHAGLKNFRFRNVAFRLPTYTILVQCIRYIHESFVLNYQPYKRLLSLHHPGPCPSFTCLLRNLKDAWHDVSLSIFPAEWITSLQTR
jgi:hypothetical protein